MAQQSDRLARAIENELVFRAVNEQIAKMTERFRTQLQEIDIVCECADPHCVGTIPIRAEEFTRPEWDESTFLVLAGHEDETVEDVVERRVRYVIVRKHATAR
jgi:hypothetical protein